MRLMHVIMLSLVMSTKQLLIFCLTTWDHIVAVASMLAHCWRVVDNSSHSLLSLSCRGRPVLSADSLQHLMKTVRTALEGSDLDTIIGASSTLAELVK